MKLNKRTRRRGKQLFRLCLVDGGLDAGRIRQVVQCILVAPHRDGGSILSYFWRLVRLHLARRTATIESAAPLPAELQAVIAAGLTRQYGAGLSIAFADRPALIGGVRIQVGSDVFDGSVRAGLAALASSF